MGHAEPAAGVAGLLALASALEGRHIAPVLHLRLLNPLVAGVLSGRNGHAPLHAKMPRTEAAAGSMRSQQHGESGFPGRLVTALHRPDMTIFNNILTGTYALRRRGECIRLPGH